MEIKDCKDCGEYKYIESDGKCRDCCIDKYELRVDDKITEVELTDKQYVEIYTELMGSIIVSDAWMDYVDKEIEFNSLSEHEKRFFPQSDSLDCSTESLIGDIEEVIGKDLDFSDE